MSFLIPADDDELVVLSDALVCFAAFCDERGDTDTAKRADELQDRLRVLRPLVFANAEEWLRCCGLGPHYRRPQG